MYKTIFQHQAERGIGIVKIEKFEEGKHPRGKDGKFTSGGGQGKEDKPEQGKQYALTGGTGEPSILAGNTWAESEVKSSREAITTTQDISNLNPTELKDMIPAGSYRGKKDGDKTVIRDGTNTRTFVWQGGKPVLEGKGYKEMTGGSGNKFTIRE